MKMQSFLIQEKLQLVYMEKIMLYFELKIIENVVFELKKNK